VLYGTGEMAEIAFLTINELRLELAGVVECASRPERFLGSPVQAVGELVPERFDRMIVCSLRGGASELAELLARDELAPRLIILPLPGLLGALPPLSAAAGAIAPPIPALTASRTEAVEAVSSPPA